MNADRARSIRQAWPAAAAVAMFAVLAYLPGIHGGFVFDDYPNILLNSALRTTETWGDWLAAALSSPARELPRPLAMVSFAINLRLGGFDPVPFKLVNIAIHALNALLAFALARRIAETAGESARAATGFACLAAGAWALHPINATAVLLVVQRMESLSHVFVFAGLWLYCRIRSRQGGQPGGWLALYATTIGFTAMGVMAKESAALLPLYAFCLELFLFRFRSCGEGRRLAAFFVACLALPALAGLAWLLPKALAPGAFDARDFTLHERLLTEPRVLVEYLRWFFVPAPGRLSFFHDDFAISRGLLQPASTLLAMVALAALALGAWLLRRRLPVAALGLSWFLCAHALTATFIPLELVFEHRNYFASFGMSLAVVALATRASRALAATPSAARLGLGVGTALVLCLGGLTALRAYEWRDPLAFAQSEAAKKPASPRAVYYLGWMLANATGYQRDSAIIDPAFAALDRARALEGSGILPDQAQLILAARTGRPLRQEWWRHMQRRLREHPVGPQETGALGSLTDCQISGQCEFPVEEMMATYGAALSHGPHPIVLGVYANYALNELGDAELALRLWREAQALSPQEREHTIALAKLLMREGQFDAAQREIDRLRRMGRLGQHRRAADELQLRLAREKAAAGMGPR